jgi:hypothetical protein
MAIPSSSSEGGLQMTEELEPHLDFPTNPLVASQIAFWPSIVNISHYKRRLSFINPKAVLETTLKAKASCKDLANNQQINN